MLAKTRAKMTKLNELKAAYEAATNGKWAAPGFNSQGGQVACLLDNPDGLRLVSGNFKRSDAEFIALAHNLMPTLIEAATELARFIDYLDTASGDGAYEHEIQRALAILEKLEMS